MRVLHVITDTDRRGAQVFATDLAQAMAARGHSVDTVALAAGGQTPSLEVDALGHRRRSPATLRALRRRMSAADVTIAHGSATGLACAVAGAGSHPFVYRQISDTRFWADTRLRRWRVARYLNSARAVVALSEGARRDLIEHLGLPADLIRIVPNGVPVGSFGPSTTEQRAAARARFGLSADAFVGLYIGALVPEKGVREAVVASAQVDGMQLLVVGDGPQRLALEELSARIAPDRVHLAGVLEDPLAAYAAADVVLLPSKGGDSMPATLIEAGFCALPSIATPVGSIEDIVLHGQTGFIVDDGVDGLVSALRSMRADPGWRESAGLAAREHCLANFEIGVVGDRWLEVLQEVVSAARGSRQTDTAR